MNRMDWLRWSSINEKVFGVYPGVENGPRAGRGIEYVGCFDCQGALTESLHAAVQKKLWADLKTPGSTFTVICVIGSPASVKHLNGFENYPLIPTHCAETADSTLTITHLFWMIHKSTLPTFRILFMRIWSRQMESDPFVVFIADA